ncbi:hypothetical protein ElyMa_006454200 [Elysia marginata]|uniref:Uncharacterized protein n=1 Tax=Elysia marginata TaxID=1093978 RepID=A0AAV4HY00_9GAST|nr:hypothetical protein ElyMa_006454200 [Elysia marginata]
MFLSSWWLSGLELIRVWVGITVVLGCRDRNSPALRSKHVVKIKSTDHNVTSNISSQSSQSDGQRGPLVGIVNDNKLRAANAWLTNMGGWKGYSVASNNER